jgi:hypothetical protein
VIRSFHLIGKFYILYISGNMFKNHPTEVAATLAEDRTSGLIWRIVPNMRVSGLSAILTWVK